MEKDQPTAPEGVPAGDANPQDQAVQAIREKVIEALETVYDPEIPVNIYELGLIYGIDVTPAGEVVIRMTLTAPGCPVAGYMPTEVEKKAFEIDGVTSCRVDLVWEPQWNPDMMSDAAKLQLGYL